MSKWNEHLTRSIALGMAIVMVCTFLFVGALPAKASETVLKVGYADTDPIFVDEEGEYSGYGVSYLEEIGKYAAWEYEFILDTWENCLQKLESGELDLLIMAHHTAERDERFLYSALPMAHDYPVLYAPYDSGIFYQDYAAFDGCRVGVSDATVYGEAVIAHWQDLGLHCEVVSFPDDAEAEAAMLRGEIDMVVTSVFTPLSNARVVDRFAVSPAYILTNLQNESVMKRLDSAMQKVKIHDPNLEEILMRTFYNVSKDVSNLYLTREEQAYLESVGPIVIKSFEDRYPMGYTDENGVFKGVLVDYMNQISAMSGLTFVYEAADYSSFEENVDAMQAEGFGILWAGDPVKSMGLEDVLLETNPLFDTSLAYIRRQGEYVTKYDPHTFVVSTDMRHIEPLLLETNRESKILYFASAKECMDAVMSGEAEMAILNDQVAAYWLQKPIYIAKLTQVAGSGVYMYGMRLYVPKEHQHLVNILNKTLDHLSDTQKLHMVNNASLTYTYEYGMDDMIYKYKDTMAIIAALVLVIFAMLLWFGRFKTRLKEEEAERLRHQMQENRQIFQIVSEHSNRLLYVYDLQSRTTKLWDEDNAEKDVLSHLYSEHYSEQWLQSHDAILAESKESVKTFFADIHGGKPSGEMTLPIKLLDGALKWYHFKYSSIFRDGVPLSAAISVEDVTEERLEQMALQSRSERDGMTGLYNRSTAEELIRARLSDEAMGIFVILDLDHLKQINDTYGHDEGDRAIIGVAETLKAHFRSGDIIGRMGGDEFVIYLPGAAENRETMEEVFALLLRKLRGISVGKNGEMSIRCSIGCVVEQEGSAYESLFKQADRALYHVKKNGRNDVAFYVPTMEDEALAEPMG